jgi:hypothetical protein
VAAVLAGVGDIIGHPGPATPGDPWARSYGRGRESIPGLLPRLIVPTRATDAPLARHGATAAGKHRGASVAHPPGGPPRVPEG